MMVPLMIPRPVMGGGQSAVVPIKFSPESEAKLAGVDPRLAALMRAVEAKHPDAFEITEGPRDVETQRKYVAQGKSQTMNSKHLTGNAVDIALLGPDGKPNWDFEAYRPIADTAKATAAAMGIPDFIWGGDWKTLKDGVHFQVGGPGTKQAPASAPVSAPAAAPAGGVVNPPPTIIPVNMQGSPKTMWETLAEIGASMMPDEEQQQAPQLMPMQRTAYVAPQIDTIDPYLKFFASLR